MAKTVFLEGAALQKTESFGVPPETFGLTRLKNRTLLRRDAATRRNPTTALDSWGIRKNLEICQAPFPLCDSDGHWLKTNASGFRRRQAHPNGKDVRACIALMFFAEEVRGAPGCLPEQRTIRRMLGTGQVQSIRFPDGSPRKCQAIFCRWLRYQPTSGDMTR